MAKPIVAIVGRPNVGKSTLFNRIARAQISIVESRPGVTRDRVYTSAEWTGREFTIVDTGGLDPLLDDELVSKVREQAEIAIREADVIIFVVDARAGLTSNDYEVAELLRRAGKPVIVAANKVDHPSVETYELFSLGLGDPIPISAAHGAGVGDLLDAVVERLPEREAEDEEEASAIRIAFVGRPNVGKSSLFNIIVGEERSIVSPIPGTTRDAVDTYVKIDGRDFVFIDTAGLRRKSKIHEPVERYSVIRALRAVDRCHVAVLVIDATEGASEQDAKIAGYIQEAGRGCVIALNKWDLVPDKETNTLKKMELEVLRVMPFMSYAPIVSTSAATGQRVKRLLETVTAVHEQLMRRIPTATLNQVIEDAVLKYPHPSVKGQTVKVKYATQVGVNPPKFAVFVSRPDLVHFSYERYLENAIREAFGFSGVPVKLFTRSTK